MRLENYEEGQQVEGALQELSNGGFGLKISQFLAEIWPIFYFFHKSGCNFVKNGPIFKRKPALES